MNSIPGVLETKQTVDPAVSRTKFERELSAFKRVAGFNQLRGIILRRAEYPNFIFSFLAYKVRPAVVAFTVRINFTNYDVEAPSIQFIDPITEQLIRVEELCTEFPRKVQIPVPLPNGNTTLTDVLSGKLIQSHAPHHVPFVCLPGIREYHDHTYHSNDPWLDHRGKGEGTLGFILDQLHAFGTNPLAAVTPQSINASDAPNGGINLQFQGIKFIFDVNSIPI